MSRQEDGHQGEPFLIRKAVSITFFLCGMAAFTSVFLVPEDWKPTEDRFMLGFMSILLFSLSVYAWIEPKTHPQEKNDELNKTKNERAD